MIKTYSGFRYSFEVESQPYKDKFAFTITAIHKESRRYSRINTLNQVLAEFEIKADNPRAVESEWLLTKRESRDFMKIANYMFSDNKYLWSFESILDEIRKSGEWENIRREKRHK
ncbi:MAG: hypothetical protein EPO24_04205 [Bacteroidetes bacterium]|nr:MAG: hypothetical protein EPO24_04205 [Bacteroidota bacterium]